LAQWKKNIVDDEETIWSLEQLDWAETAIFITLACMERHCPDPSMRAYAKGQLQDQFWNRQKSMSIMEQ
jgi:hypothetical protein